MSRFDGLISDLATTIVSDRACNQYSRIEGDLRGNAIRRRNLRLYLEELDAIGPRMLLVGEAVSHRGGRLSGIAFVSESVMLSGVDLANNSRILGADRGYRKATPGPKLSTEASATMVWGTIRAIEPLPLLWNAFQFHPFKPESPLSNRVPAPAELEIGSRFIARLMRLFDFEQVVAIGNQAASSLTKMGIAHEKVRHPSMAGKAQFVEGMARLTTTSAR
ncbi:MAG TPA: uracil-DNA glycosylase [Thermoanaerobaculia bacterium]|nr:uracil-DNA glycosylase [Thermoanaerobaculia bacterium]